MGQTEMTRGFFSLLRWRADVTRDEAKNVAVLLVDPRRGESALRAAPISAISPRLREQGLLDSMVAQLEQRLKTELEPTVETLGHLSASLQHSLYVTEPRPVAIPSIEGALSALFKAFVSPAVARPRHATKGVVLDRVVATFRRRGLEVARGEILDDFIFDAVVSARGVRLPTVVEVLSFETPRKDWTPVLHDAAHFLFAVEHVDADRIAIVQPPRADSDRSAVDAHERVGRWFRGAETALQTLDQFVSAGQQSLGVG